LIKDRISKCFVKNIWDKSLAIKVCVDVSFLLHCMAVFHRYSVDIHVVKNLGSMTMSKVVATINLKQITILDKFNDLFDCDSRRILYVWRYVRCGHAKTENLGLFILAMRSMTGYSSVVMR
jgi:hypothetical protein